MSVTVVVPTRDRPEKLERCLAALRSQGAEIVVVDDGSTEAERVGKMTREAETRLVRLEGRGPAAARNAGVAAAGGEVVCFIDDDCEASERWVEQLVAPLLAGEVECVAGRTVVADDASAADRAWQAIADHLQREGSSPGSASPGFATTCNLACSRRLLEELPFDESFPTAAGEDRDWAARAAARGAAPLFVPAAVVTHRPGLNASSFLRQQYRYGRGAAEYRAADASRRPGAPGFYAGLIRAGFRAGPVAGGLVLAAQAMTAAGILSARAAARRRGRSSQPR